MQIQIADIKSYDLMPVLSKDAYKYNCHILNCLTLLWCYGFRLNAILSNNPKISKNGQKWHKNDNLPTLTKAYSKPWTFCIGYESSCLIVDWIWNIDHGTEEK